MSSAPVGVVNRSEGVAKMLTRYWFRFRPIKTPSVLNLGCGITAYDLDDAKRFLETEVFPIFGKREIEDVIENVDISQLEHKHVRPNMGSPVARGVWFPWNGRI
jgi:hypothetical protein